MPTKPLFFKVLTGAILCTLAACFALLQLHVTQGGTPFILGLLIGIAVQIAALYCLFRAWKSAPSASRVVLWYILRVALIGISIITCAFIPTIVNAVPVIVAQLFAVPILAVLLAVQKD